MRIEKPGESPSTWTAYLVVALFVGLPFATLVPSAARFIGAVAVCVVLVVSFREQARIDRSGFASVAIPTVVLVLLGFGLPWRVALGLDWAAAFLFVLFAFAGGSFVPWWYRIILRRRNVAFALKLSAELREVTRLATRVMSGADLSMRAIVSLERQVARVRGLDAPTAQWSELRDAYVDEWDVIMALAHRSANLQEYEAETVRASALRARFAELLSSE